MLSHLRIDLWFFDLFDRIGNKERILSYGTWITAKRVLNPGALTLARAWVVLFPLIAFLASLLPLEMQIDRISIIIGESYVPPFNIALSIISAISLILADAVYKIFCPDVVQRYEPVFNKFPKSYPPDMADEVYRSYLFSGIPQVLKLSAPNIEFRRQVDYRYKATDFYFDSNSVKDVLSFEVKADEIYAVLQEPLEFNKQKVSPLYEGRRYLWNSPIYLMGGILFGDDSDVLADFRRFYEFLVVVRILPRLIFWLFYMIGAVLGVCLTAQIMWRALMFAVSV